MRVFKRVFLVVFISFMASCQQSNERKVFTENDIAVIPKPAKLALNKGAFQFDENTKFIIADAPQREIVFVLSDKFKSVSNWDLEILEQAPQKNYVQLLVDENLRDEAYKLEVNSNRILITSKRNAGFLYGIETLRQLLPTAIESSDLVFNVAWLIPNLTIEDQPRYAYRGLMLDVTRHFFEIDYLKKTIDRLAMLKMNVLHLHLVDDQGWRIEIKKYPKLTEVGAWRVDQEAKHWDGRSKTSADEKGTYGGFYTQDELKDLVAYAATKNVEIIPEIEMPAHVSSAIASYPELSCHERPIGVPSGGVWPITDIYCAGKEHTFEFLEDVLKEVMEIFPSKYIHVGGDEATKTNWAVCADCKKRMRLEKLENVEELQSYFIKRMEHFINAKGKKLIGWDEILEGGIAPEATVMSWRGTKGGVEAAKLGHDVIMTPGTHCYFDHYQGPQNKEPLAFGGYTPLSKVYTFDPLVAGMTKTEAKHVLGGQANLWSEQIKTEAHSEYMLFPRLAALSETLWSPIESRNWEDFSSRILTMLDRYDYLDVNYAKSAYLVMQDVHIDMDTKQVSLALKNEFTNSDIRYSFSMNELKDSALKYTLPLILNESAEIYASLFKNDKPVGVAFNTSIEFHKAVGKKVTFKEIYDARYQGEGEFGMVNTLRGTKNYSDGHWQAWLGKDMEAVIDLGEETSVKELILGTLENQGSGIYFPTSITVYVSKDGKNYKAVGLEKRAYAKNPSFDLKEFKISFEKQAVRYVKVSAKNLTKTPEGGGVWLFVDEIIIH
jgi:hexosaminidase